MVTHAALAQSYWINSLAKLNQASVTGWQHYFESLPDIRDAFLLRDRSVRCIDEGTPGGVHLAGSGILLNLESAGEYLKKARVDGVYSHEECGAVGLYASKEKLDPEFCDEYAREWAKTMADYLGVPYRGHIPINKMARPGGLHVATVAYYDATGEFDFSRVQELPPGFVVSRKYLPGNYAQEELKTAVSIALGGHGFGANFTAKTPFGVIILYDSKNPDLPKEQLASEVQEVVEPNKDQTAYDLVDATGFLPK